MSNKADIKRIKTHLGRERDLSAGDRQVFGKAVKRLPYFSLYRFRTVMIMAITATCIFMSKPIYDSYHAISNGIRLERERKKFLKELDEEEASDSANTSHTHS